MGGRPKVVQPDPEGDALKAANNAAIAANADAARRKVRKGRDVVGGNTVLGGAMSKITTADVQDYTKLSTDKRSGLAEVSRQMQLSKEKQKLGL